MRLFPLFCCSALFSQFTGTYELPGLIFLNSMHNMAGSIGQNPGYINGLENKKGLPSMTVFFYICDYLNVTPKEFFDESIVYGRDSLIGLKRMYQIVFIDMGQKAQGFQADLLKVVLIDILLHKTAFPGGFLGRRCQKVLANGTAAPLCPGQCIPRGFFYFPVLCGREKLRKIMRMLHTVPVLVRPGAGYIQKPDRQ